MLGFIRIIKTLRALKILSNCPKGLDMFFLYRQEKHINCPLYFSCCAFTKISWYIFILSVFVITRHLHEAQIKQMFAFINLINQKIYY